MGEFFNFGVTTPTDESCAQVGSREYDYHDRARFEAKTLIAQLRRTFGKEPSGARLSVKSHPHDFGNYLTVGCYIESGDQPAMEYAQKMDAMFPTEWDEEARKEFQLSERR